MRGVITNDSSKLTLFDDTFAKTQSALGGSKINRIDDYIVLYGFLHEIGHFNDFVLLGEKPSELLRIDRKIVEQKADDFTNRWLTEFIDIMPSQ